LAISAIVLAAIGGVFYSVLRLRERTSSALDRSAMLQQALGIIRRDIQGTVAPGGEMAGYFQAPAAGGGMSGNSSIRFRTTCGSINGNAAWGDLMEVMYDLRAPLQLNRGPGNDLVRTISHNLLGTMGQDVEEQRILNNVQSAQFACYDGVQWLDTWDTSSANTNLPTALRFRLQMAAGSSSDNRDQQQIEMVFPLVSQSRTNQTQTTGVLP
jgi:hypothetical protein